MSTELESVIRPFESGRVSPSQTYYPAGQIGVPNVKLQYGRNGGGKTLSGSYSFNESFYLDHHEAEKEQRPDDPFKLTKHIIRLFGQDANGHPVEDVYIDV